jgi:hypothetical protein
VVEEGTVIPVVVILLLLVVVVVVVVGIVREETETGKAEVEQIQVLLTAICHNKVSPIISPNQNIRIHIFHIMEW